MKKKRKCYGREFGYRTGQDVQKKLQFIKNKNKSRNYI